MTRTCERLSKSDTNGKEDRREMAEVVRACKAKGRRSSAFLSFFRKMLEGLAGYVKQREEQI